MMMMMQMIGFLVIPTVWCGEKQGL